MDWKRVDLYGKMGVSKIIREIEGKWKVSEVGSEGFGELEWIGWCVRLWVWGVFGK